MSNPLGIDPSVIPDGSDIVPDSSGLFNGNGGGFTSLLDGSPYTTSVAPETPSLTQNDILAGNAGNEIYGQGIDSFLSDNGNSQYDFSSAPTAAQVASVTQSNSFNNASNPGSVNTNNSSNSGSILGALGGALGIAAAGFAAETAKQGQYSTAEVAAAQTPAAPVSNAYLWIGIALIGIVLLMDR